MKSNRNSWNSDSSASVPWELIGAFPLFIVAGSVAVHFPISLAGAPGAGFVTFALAGLGGVIMLSLLARSRYHASDVALVIRGPIGSRQILYRNISRVDRVRREAGGSTGRVRITYRRAGQTGMVDLTPECPEALVWDILQHCPHLTGMKIQKIVRNRSFKAVRGPAFREMKEDDPY